METDSLKYELESLEQELKEFWRHNSQSNPGAHFEVKPLKKQIQELKRLLKAAEQEIQQLK